MLANTYFFPDTSTSSLWGTFCLSNSKSIVLLQALAGGPLVQARNFAVMTGVNAGITCVMKRVRGKEDIQSRQVFAMPHRSPLIL